MRFIRLGMFSNFVPVLAKYWQPLPMLVLGVPAILAAVLSFHLQETSGKDLPQTMKEAEVIGTDIEDGRHGHDNKAMMMGESGSQDKEK